MEPQAHALSFDLCRAEAINAEDIAPEETLRLKNLEFPGSENLRAIIAVTRSHMKIWETTAASSDPNGCVLEGDVVLSENSRAVLSDLGWIPVDADVVKLETNLTPVLGHRPPATCCIGDVALQRFLIRKLVGRHLGIAGYTISRKTACNEKIRPQSHRPPPVLSQEPDSPG